MNLTYSRTPSGALKIAAPTATIVVDAEHNVYVAGKVPTKMETLRHETWVTRWICDRGHRHRDLGRALRCDRSSRR